MPKGGKRVGAGRPTKEQQELKAKLLAETIARGLNLPPKVYLQGLLNSPGSTKYERLRAAELLLRYPPDPVARASAEPSPQMSIISIPREVFLTKEQIVDIEELAAKHGQPIEPYTGSGDWTQTVSDDDRRKLEVMDAPDDGKVARLHPAYGRVYSSGRRLAAGPRDDDDSAA